ncbi:MAG: ACP S-malonyltransferase [Chloroflexi bacterium HGW-Chloroflexi-1]|nr:MAG: ACP S-malonyltransferase [Chloroflexi bacterium HGW-Chloroflexi-1]
MQIVLSDHNCEGQARALFRAFDTGGYLKLIPMELRLFVDVGLSASAEDAAVWQYCQDNGCVLLTGNRKTSDGERSLESTIRRLRTSESLPVLIISNLRRVLTDPAYCQDCALRLAEVILDIETYRGVHRLYLPG